MYFVVADVLCPSVDNDMGVNRPIVLRLAAQHETRNQQLICAHVHQSPVRKGFDL